jgi:enoyl-CoA hydratase/carnithine racemase
MNYEAIRVSTCDGITTLAFNRPDKMNAITPKMLDEFNYAIGWCERDAATKVVILTGEGRAFSAGVDLQSLGERRPEAGAVGGALDEPARAFINALRAIPKVVIAKVNGFCFTGALEIALGCDLIYAAEEAKFGDTHVKWGLRPTWGMSQRLPRLIGYARARELSFTADTFTGKQAAAWGLANAAVPLAELDTYVDSIAKKIAANSLEAVAAVKDLYNAGMATTLEQGLEIERTRSYPISDTATRLAQFVKK